MPLTTSRLVNQLPVPTTQKSIFKVSGLDRLHHHLRNYNTADQCRFQKTDHAASSAMHVPIIPVVPLQLPSGSTPMDALLARLSNQQGRLAKQKDELEAQHNNSIGSRSSSVSTSEQPTTDPYATTPRTSSHNASDSPPDAAELLRLKQELVSAQTRIARMDQELSQSRITKHTMEQALGSQFDAEYDHTRDLAPQTVVNRVDNWMQQTEPVVPPVTAPIKYEGGPPARSIWNAGFASTAPGAVGQGGVPVATSNGWSLPDTNGASDARMGPSMTHGFLPSSGSALRHQQPSPLRLDASSIGPYYNDRSPLDVSMRSSGQSSRPPSAFGNHLQAWSHFNATGSASDQPAITPPITPLSFQGMHGPMDGMPPMPPMHPLQHGMQQSLQHPGMVQHGMQPYMPRPIGTRLSPMAAEFHGTDDFGRPQPWHMQQVRDSATQRGRSRRTDTRKSTPEPPASYMSTAEPMNYRRLLDRNMSCNWKYIVDKIVCSNDQQASIFLQQKLKVGTTEQKFEIVQAIIDQAYPLMVNRFGNFLVQRCFEHGTPEQVISIARAIRGNTLNLSMDAFGCHVVQKAFDCVPEEYKAIMVHELLRRIPETVIHRYACHVWQKLFELRWSDSPPQIMKYVNEALRGMWHEVALGETGSLVVQNIFENCLEEDKV